LEYIHQLEGSAETKERVRAILQTMHGDLRVQEACRRLRLSASRFQQIREQFIQGGIDNVESQPPGRPRAAAATAAQVQALEQALAEKEVQLHEAQVREEVALILPRVKAAESVPEKKMRRSRRRRRPMRP
jgi:hypothetical protein